MTHNKSLQAKIVIVGDSGVGKTSIIKRLTKNIFEEQISTVGFDFVRHIVKLMNGNDAALLIWDTAGNERFHSILPNYIRGALGAMIVYSMGDRKSFVNVHWWKEEVRKLCPEIPICLCANKVDMFDPPDRDEMNVLCNENGFLNWYPTSAKTGENVSQAFTALANKVFQRPLPYPSTISDSIELTHHIVQQKSGCCLK